MPRHLINGIYHWDIPKTLILMKWKVGCEAIAKVSQLQAKKLWSIGSKLTIKFTQSYSDSYLSS